MNLNDPILEALTFRLQNDLHILAQRRAELLMESTTKANEDSESCSASGGAAKEVGVPAKTVASGASTSKKSEGNSPIFSEKMEVLLREKIQTLCPFKNCTYFTLDNITADRKAQCEFLAHLLTSHQLVIENSEEIANLTMYMRYWGSKFCCAPLSDFCVGFKMEEAPAPKQPQLKKKRRKKVKEGEGNGVEGGADQEKILMDTNKVYYMLSPTLPEDMEIRKKLWKQRLDIVLEVNRQEREAKNFSRRCLFCRDVVSGNRSQYFIHMRDNHSFHIGQPDNLVFVNEFLQFIEEKLNRLECLFCENTFKDKNVLKEHMRKKLHRKINPKNKDYDKFYVVNYLEPGKTWETLELEDAEDEKKEDEWVEPSEEKEKNIVCLFCSESNSDFQKILDHMGLVHRFNFSAITSSFDFYQKVKLVNYIRRSVYQNSCFTCEKRFENVEALQDHIKSHPVIDSTDSLPSMEQWNRSEYFFPTYEDDDFLTCLSLSTGGDDAENTTKVELASSEDEGNVIPEDLPQLDMRNREFDLAGYAIRYHNQNRN